MLITIHPHAKTRMAQRGICLDQIKKVVTYGRKKHIRKAAVFFLGTKELRYFRIMDPDLELALRDSKNIHVVIEDSCVKTVYRNANPNLKEHAWYG